MAALGEKLWLFYKNSFKNNKKPTGYWYWYLVWSFFLDCLVYSGMVISPRLPGGPRLLQEFELQLQIMNQDVVQI